MHKQMKNLTKAHETTKQKIFIGNLDLVSGDPAEDGGADFGLVSIDVYQQKLLSISCSDCFCLFLLFQACYRIQVVKMSTWEMMAPLCQSEQGCCISP